MKKYKAIIYDIDGTLLDTLKMNMYPLMKIIKEETGEDWTFEQVLKFAAYPGMKVMEELGVKGLQKRSWDIRINPKTNRPFSKKRFGKAIFRAAPSGFRTALETRAFQLGIDVEVISPKDVKPSQYNHITQTFEKKPLSTRVYDLSDSYPGVQRDLYSAFLIGHIEKGHYQQDQLNQDFPDFYDQMKAFLQQTPKTKRLAWYLN